MPIYNFICKNCLNKTKYFLNLKEYFELKKNQIKCEKCTDGVLSQEIVRVNSTIEKSPDQIIMETKEEVRKTVDRVRSGDRRAIDDIYGDKLNPYKK